MYSFQIHYRKIDKKQRVSKFISGYGRANMPSKVEESLLYQESQSDSKRHFDCFSFTRGQYLIK